MAVLSIYDEKIKMYKYANMQMWESFNLAQNLKKNKWKAEKKNILVTC